MVRCITGIQLHDRFLLVLNTTLSDQALTLSACLRVQIVHHAYLAELLGDVASPEL